MTEREDEKARKGLDPDLPLIRASGPLPFAEVDEPRCASDGQTVEWHRATDPSGIRTNGEFIGCDFGTAQVQP